VRFSGSDRTVIDGPFTETKEQVAGWSILEVDSKDDVIKWVQRCPSTLPDEEWEIEIRPILGPGDFGDALTPELRESGTRLRATAAEQHS
jgi:hypothetical protein